MEYLELLGSFGIIGILFLFAVVIAAWVLSAVAMQRALKIMGYDKSWMAWIPYANYYALGDAVTKYNIYKESKMPPIFLKLWWVIALGLTYIVGGDVATYGNLFLNIAALGTVYGCIYALIEGKSYADTRVIGYISGWIGIVPLVKFLSYDKNAKVVDLASNDAAWGDGTRDAEPVVETVVESTESVVEEDNAEVESTESEVVEDDTVVENVESEVTE